MRVLHVSAQRPSHTGSGTTLANLVRVGRERGLTQQVVCGLPLGEVSPLEVPTRPLYFGGEDLPFLLPGMSDVMPYPSSRWRELSTAHIERYCAAWRTHLAREVEAFEPDVIHVHHLWVVAALCAELDVPVIAHCHATGLRQRALAPHLRKIVDPGMRQVDGIVSLTEEQGEQVRAIWPELHVQPVGAGFRAEVFHSRGRRPRPGRITYVGKLARSKGVPWLLEAVEQLRDRRPQVSLVICGLGDTRDSSWMRRLEAPHVQHFGMLTPTGLADLLRESEVFVLPSLYEGYGLVLIEALACGNRLVSTDFPAARLDLAPRIGEALTRIPMPRKYGIDEPHPSAEADFVREIRVALDAALDADPIRESDLSAFSWNAVFDRIFGEWARVTGTA